MAFVAAIALAGLPAGTAGIAYADAADPGADLGPVEETVVAGQVPDDAPAADEPDLTEAAPGPAAEEPEPTATEEPEPEPDPEEPAAEQTGAPAEAPDAPAMGSLQVPAVPAQTPRTSGIVSSNANTVPVAWVDDDPNGAEPATLMTLAQALATPASAGRYVHIVPGSDLGFGATRLDVSRSVTLVSSAPTTVSALWRITGAGAVFTDTENVRLTSNNSTSSNQVLITVLASATGATIRDVELTVTHAVTGTTGIGSIAATGVTIDNFSFAGTGTGTGINALNSTSLTIRDATVTNAGTGIGAGGTTDLSVDGASISGVTTGYYTAGTASGTGTRLSNMTIQAATTGVSLGASIGPVLTDVHVTRAGDTVANTFGISATTTSGLVVRESSISGFNTGIMSTQTAGKGMTVSDSTIDAVNMGINAGGTAAVPVLGVTIEDTTVKGGTAGSASSIGIEGFAADLTVRRVTIDGFPVGLRSRATSTGGITVEASSIIRATHGGIVLAGALDGVTVSDLVADLEGMTPHTTALGINLGASQGLDIARVTVRGYPTAIGSGAVADAGPTKRGGTIDDVTVTDGTSGVSLSNFGPTTISNLTLVTNAPKGSGVYLRWTDGITVRNVRVTGTSGATSTAGTNGVRSYASTNLTVTASAFVGGATGFYFDTTKDVVTTGIEISGMDWYGIYSELVERWEMTHANFHGNNAIANLTINPGPGADGISERNTSRDVRWTDSTFTDNAYGVFLALGFTGFEFARNTVTGTNTYVIGAYPAHDVHVHGNTITFSAPEGSPEAAIMVGSDLYANLGEPGDFTSSGIEVVGNEFSGSGPFVRVGSKGGQQTALSDVAVVRGNTFPTDAVAVVAPSHSGGVDGVAVDARDHGTPNEWGSVCGATGTVRHSDDDGLTFVEDIVHDGGGATIVQAAAGQVLYPTRCIDLALDITPRTMTVGVGDTVTWQLVPRNEGLADAPAGWSVVQLLPEGMELVSVTGDGYTFSQPVTFRLSTFALGNEPSSMVRAAGVPDDVTATATGALAAGEDAPAITVTARFADAATRPSGQVRLVAYVAPLADGLATDLDGDGFPDIRVEHPGALEVPGLDTDTDVSATNNDAQLLLSVTAATDDGTPSPTPTPNPTPSPAPTPTPDSRPVTPGGPAVDAPAVNPVPGTPPATRNRPVVIVNG